MPRTLDDLVQDALGAATLTMLRLQADNEALKAENARLTAENAALKAAQGTPNG
jgi:hypothetical protein